MKNCPNCNAELEDNFNLCWNCNYSLTDEEIIPEEEFDEGHRNLNCLRCDVKMKYSGVYKFHEGFNTGVLGGLFELLVNKESFELYLCLKCGKVEFFSPLI
ncbi:hypothetical protein ACE1ET_00210 [Saccharicrinis sp. FJH62]|uniref:hypothetical protein n=1 Tax=Saccharicrinis sp. FJH62 TaxID=3344657 RepID=UPI0035D514E8